jgi:hypothetical protein
MPQRLPTGRESAAPIPSTVAGCCPIRVWPIRRGGSGISLAGERVACQGFPEWTPRNIGVV